MEEVFKYLNNLLTDGDTVVIACSGGPDSMALLHILINTKRKLKLICAHVNHNVRTESKEEAVFVKKYCENHNVIFETISIDNWNDDNFHNQARTVRYNFFEELVEKYNANYLMTAHHGDDLMETILMRIVRGSTLKGYAGFDKIVQKENYSIVRPLVELTKDSIEKYCQDNNIEYRIDYTNNEDHYTRNRYRHHLLPFLKSEDSNVHKKFIKFHETLKKTSDFIDKIVSNEYEKSYQNNTLNLDYFNTLDEIVKTKIIETILHTIYNDDLFRVDDSHINIILDIANSTKANTSINLPNNIFVKKEYNKLMFTKKKEEVQEYVYELIDEVYINNNKIVIEANCDLTNNYCTRINSSEVTLPLIVRSKKDGDKMTIKNLEGSKKIKNIFIDEKTNLEARKTWPIVTDSKGTIIWLPGLKKSKFDKSKDEKYDIILRYHLEKEQN